MDHKEVSAMGGRASRSNMSKKRATEISLKANRARWAKHRAQKKTASKDNESDTKKTA